MVRDDFQLRQRLTAILEAAGIENAALEAQWIAEDHPDAAEAEAIAHRRAQHEPLQYLLNYWEFYGLPFKVGEGVLSPRQDTETLVDAVLSRISGKTGLHAVDLCTGSGCIALALKSQRNDLHVTGIELSDDALRYALENAKLLGLDADLRKGDVLDPQTAAQFHDLDLIVCNPPYLTAEDMQHLQPEVAHEPAAALFGGEDGLDYYRNITKLWKDALRIGGILCYEAGMGQAQDVAAIMRNQGFEEIGIIPDAAGIERVILGYKKF
ncbi:MAG: peptide chain release factor N(5)-glutamine methyltransferase [Oscillospiraceae bacterium]|nr:peptide chain release factor N(5)-glutamine methyltransferase [Oscillospiraceae bacterium]